MLEEDENSASLVLPRCICNWRDCRRYARNFRDSDPAHKFFDGVLSIKFKQADGKSMKLKEAWDRYLEPKDSSRESWKDGEVNYTVARHHFTETLIREYIQNKKTWDWTGLVTKDDADSSWLFEFSDEDSFPISDTAEIGYLKVPDASKEHVERFATRWAIENPSMKSLLSRHSASKSPTRKQKNKVKKVADSPIGLMRLSLSSGSDHSIAKNPNKKSISAVGDEKSVTRSRSPKKTSKVDTSIRSSKSRKKSPKRTFKDKKKVSDPNLELSFCSISREHEEEKNTTCPTRKVIEQAMATGPDTGWCDGWLTFNKGLCEPEHGSSRVALWRTKGRPWATMAEQMSSLIEGLLVRLRVLKLPLISADASSIPKEALIAAEIALSTLAHAFRFEWQNANPEIPWKLEFLPETIVKPWTQACDRLGMPGVGLGINAFFLGRYQFKDNALWSEEEPYAERIENIRFNPAVFGSREERVFMGCFVETCAIVSVGIQAFVDAQEAVMLDNPKLLRGALRELKRIADRMVVAFNKISTMKVAGSNYYCDPIIWGNTIAPYYAPINPEKDSPGGSGLYHPVFHMFDVFFNRRRYDSSLGLEAFHLRHWFPKNIQDFIEALDDPDYRIPEYVEKVEARIAAGEDLPHLRRAYDQARLAYAGERGWMGQHRYKVFGFLQIVSKAGRTNTNGGVAEGEKPWEAVHKELHNSRAERLPPGEGETRRDGAGMCPYLASVKARNPIDADPLRNTQQVVLEVPEGLWWKPGDRLITIVPNSEDEVAATIAALRRNPSDRILLDQKWSRWFEQANKTLGLPMKRSQGVPLETIVRFSRLRPLGFHEVVSLREGLSDYITDEECRVCFYLESPPTWPVHDNVTSLIHDAVPLSQAMKLSGSKICSILSPQTPRTYSISNIGPENEQDETKAQVELTVTRQGFKCPSPSKCPSEKAGVSSGFFSPPPELPSAVNNDDILVGLQSPLNFSLPNRDRPIVMVGAGSGIAPFRSFWQHRERQPQSQTWLLFGCRNEQTMLYHDEINQLLKRDRCDFRPYVTFSRVENKRTEFGPNGLKIVDGPSRGKYVSDMIEKDEALASAIVDMLLPTSSGGLGGSFYVCGSVPFYKGLMGSLRSVLTLRDMDASEVIRTAFSERRFMVEAHGSANGSVDKAIDWEAPVVWQSDLANREGLFAIDGNVYDVSEFMDTHPGGRRILQDVCGTDATHAFCAVAHDVNSEVIGMMESLHVGQFKVIDGSVIQYSTMATTERGRWLPELMDIARETLYSCVETQNVYENELNSILEDDDDDEKVVVRIRRLTKFCGRFLGELDDGGECLGYRGAEEVGRLASQIIPHEVGWTAAAFRPWICTQHSNWAEYVLLVNDSFLEIDGLDCVAARLTSQAKLDYRDISAKLVEIAKQGLEMNKSIKHALIDAIKDLETVFLAACEEEEADLSTLLESSMELPSTLSRIFTTRCAAAASVVAVSARGSKASSLSELCDTLQVASLVHEGIEDGDKEAAILADNFADEFKEDSTKPVRSRRTSQGLPSSSPRISLYRTMEETTGNNLLRQSMRIAGGRKSVQFSQGLPSKRFSLHTTMKEATGDDLLQQRMRRRSQSVRKSVMQNRKSELGGPLHTVREGSQGNPLSCVRHIMGSL